MQPTSPTASGKARRTRRELRLLLIVSAAMLAFGAACWLAFPHATPIVKGWLGRRHLPALKRFTQEQDWKQTIREMKEASRWAPDDPDVLHASLDLIYHAEGDPRTMMALINRLRQTGAATPADLALLGRIHIRQGDLSKARDLLAQLPEQTLRQTAGLRLQADILAADGRPDEAADTLRTLLTNDPDNSEVLMELALADLSSNDPGRRESIRERLWKAAHSGARALDAIELLAQTRDLTAPRAKELLDLVEQAQGADSAKASAHLKVLSAQMRISPQLRNDILQAEIRRWSNRPPAETAPLLAWLAQEREHALILRLVPAPMAARHTSLLPYYVSALRGEGKWQELGRLLKSGGIDTAFSAQKIRLWLAETQANLENDPTRAVQTLTRVFEEAGRGENLAETLEAARLAEQLGQWELAERCYQALAVKHPNNRQAMLAKLYELAESQHDGPAMLRACASLLEQKPENAALQLQNLYLQMLIGTQIEIAQQKLQERSEAGNSGKADLFHLVHALSAHRQGQPEKVRAALSKIARPENLPAGQRVVYASLLKGCGGDPGRVFRLVERVPPLLLLPEEKTFLQRAL
jgi:tetratricopeptide (TPR) repeat protein